MGRNDVHFTQKLTLSLRVHRSKLTKTSRYSMLALFTSVVDFSSAHSLPVTAVCSCFTSVQKINRQYFEDMASKIRAQ